MDNNSIEEDTDIVEDEVLDTSTPESESPLEDAAEETQLDTDETVTLDENAAEPSLTSEESSTEETIPEVVEQQGQLEQPATDWEKRYKGSTASWQEEKAAREELQARFDQLELKQNEIDAKNFDPWDSRSSRHTEWQTKQPLIASFRRLHSSTTSQEERVALAEQWIGAGIITPDDLETADRHRVFQERKQAELTTPEGIQAAIEDYVGKAINGHQEAQQQNERQFREYTELLQNDKEFFDNNPDALQAINDTWDELGNTGSAAAALELLKYRHASKATNSKLVENARKTALADAQTTASKGKATGERIASEPTTDYDTYEEAKKELKSVHNSQNTGSDEFRTLLLKHERISQARSS